MNTLLEVARHHPLTRPIGRVSSVDSSVIEASGPAARLGDLCQVRTAAGNLVQAEVIGLRPGRVLLMPCASSLGIGLGDPVSQPAGSGSVAVSEQMVGRVIDAFGAPIDAGPPLGAGKLRSLRPTPLNPMTRPGIDQPLKTGVRAMDAFLSMGRGQRMGIFAGSGVGKSTLLGMLARNAACDIQVIALIGERGREVRDFLEEHLGDEGRRRSVVVVATSDQPAVVRARAALTATTVAEFFRDQGRHVILMMDSITRFAMARREIELAAGQPPTARGYTPGVFADIPALCERAGTVAGGGSITGLYTVLVEGDDHNEPIADTLRATLDGHVVLSRELANEGHFPSIDVLRSISRLAHGLLRPEHRDLQALVRARMATFARHREMVEMGLYKAGSNREIDEACALVERMRPFLRQRTDEVCEPQGLWDGLAAIVKGEEARRG